MATKTYPQLDAQVDVEDADLLASYRSIGPLKKLLASALKAYAQTDVPGANTLFVPPETGAVTGTMQDKARLQIDSIDVVPLADRANVIAGTSTVNYRAELQNVLTYLGDRGGGRLRLIGTTTLSPFSSSNNMLNVYSNTAIVGNSPYEGVKVSSTAGNYRTIFGPAEACDNVLFQGFTINQNASGNTSTTIKPGGLASQALDAIGFFDFAVSHLTVDGLIFLEACGVNTVSINTDATGTGATDIVVRNILHEFLQGAYDPSITKPFYDNSSVYIIGTRVTCTNNHYRNTGTLGDAVTAEELHGKDIVGWGSEVEGYQYHSILVSELTVSGLPNNIVYGGYVSNNCRSGPILYSTTAGGLDGVTVGPGISYLADTTDFPSADITDPQVGVGFWYLVGGGVDGFLKNILLRDILIAGPSVEDADLNVASAHLYLEAEGAFENVVASNVRSINAPNNGARIVSHSATAQTGVVVENFRATDPGGNSLSAVRNGLIWDGVAGAGCALHGTRIVDTGSPLNGSVGIELQFLDAGSNLLAYDNLSISTQGITPQRINGSQYAFEKPTRVITASGGTYTLITRDGTKQFYLAVSVTSGVSIVVDTNTLPTVGNLGEIEVFIKNTSGGTTAVTWSGDFALSWTNLTSGQSASLTFKWNQAVTKWVQQGAMVAVTA